MDDLEPSYEYSATGFPVSRPIQYFGLAFRTPNTIRLVNVDQHIASCVQEKVEQLLPVEKSGYVCFRQCSPPQKKFTARGANKKGAFFGRFLKHANQTIAEKIKFLYCSLLFLLNTWDFFLKQKIYFKFVPSRLGN